MDDAPPHLLAQCRVLAREVDANPRDHRLHSEYGDACNDLWEAISGADDEGAAGVAQELFELAAECEASERHHGRILRCGECVAESDGLLDVDTWRPPTRVELEGRAVAGPSGAEPVVEIDDDAFARAAVREFLRRPRGAQR